jgi:hypothetical protein
MNSNRKYKTENKNRKEKEEKNITWPSSPPSQPNYWPNSTAQRTPSFQKHLWGRPHPLSELEGSTTP